MLHWLVWLRTGCWSAEQVSPRAERTGRSSWRRGERERLLWLCLQRWQREWEWPCEVVLSSCSWACSSSFSCRASWLKLRTSCSSAFKARTASFRLRSSCSCTREALPRASIAVLSSACKRWLLSSSSAALRYSSLVNSAWPRRATLSAVRAALRLANWSSLLRKVGSSRSTMRTVSTLWVRSSRASSSERASILREQPSTLRCKAFVCSSLVSASACRRAINSFLARNCFSRSSIVVIDCWYWRVIVLELLSCLLRASLSSRSEANSLAYKAVILASWARMASLSLLRSPSKEEAREEQSWVMMREVRAEFSMRSPSYLLLSSAYCSLSWTYSLLSLVTTTTDLPMPPRSFHSRSCRKSRSISACRAFRYSFLLSFSFSSALLQSRSSVISFSHSSCGESLARGLNWKVIDDTINTNYTHKQIALIISLKQREASC